jgi:cell division protein FtsN
VEKVAPVDPPFATVTAPTSTPTKPTAKAASSSRSGSYSVQVAAYTRRNQADKLVSSLTKRGFQARVDGNAAPFRVRIGRYATSREAEDALTKIKAKHMDGFVARVLER